MASRFWLGYERVMCACKTTLGGHFVLYASIILSLKLIVTILKSYFLLMCLCMGKHMWSVPVYIILIIIRI